MKYGVFLPNFGGFGTARVMADWAKDAESAGWDGFFIWDHIARPIIDNLVDPFVAMTAIAMNTATIRFGAMITPIPRRRPWQLARQTASLDQLSGGRLIMGFGIGSSRPQEWDAFGEELDTRKRAQMLDEGLDILTGLWTGEPFRYEGQHYQVKDSQFLPASTQQPRIPIWIGGNYPAKPPMRRAAKWDGMFIHITEDPAKRLDEFKASIDFVLENRETSAHFDVIYQDVSPAGTSHQQMIDLAGKVENLGATWWLDNMIPTRFNCVWDSTWDVDAMHEWMMQGPPRA